MNISMKRTTSLLGLLLIPASVLLAQVKSDRQAANTQGPPPGNPQTYSIPIVPEKTFQETFDADSSARAQFQQRQQSLLSAVRSGEQPIRRDDVRRT